VEAAHRAGSRDRHPDGEEGQQQEVGPEGEVDPEGQVVEMEAEGVREPEQHGLSSTTRRWVGGAWNTPSPSPNACTTPNTGPRRRAGRRRVIRSRNAVAAVAFRWNATSSTRMAAAPAAVKAPAAFSTPIWGPWICWAGGESTKR
jgi:hypothetical protein